MAQARECEPAWTTPLNRHQPCAHIELGLGYFFREGDTGAAPRSWSAIPQKSWWGVPPGTCKLGRRLPCTSAEAEARSSRRVLASETGAWRFTVVAESRSGGRVRITLTSTRTERYECRAPRLGSWAASLSVGSWLVRLWVLEGSCWKAGLH